MAKPLVLSAIIATLMLPGATHAGIFGSLANFDVVNDTGLPAYGFEIEIDDPSFDHTKLTSIFGYDRDFGLPGGPGAVVRFGKPTITDLPNVGVKITYGGGNNRTISTPSGPYNTPGESCWPFGSGWSTAAPCDHYGVSTLGQPAATKYSWLLDTNPGAPLTPRTVAIPAVQFAYTPPAPPPAPNQPPAAPARVNAQIIAVAPPAENPENPALWGEPFWVKTFTTEVAHNIDLGHLFRKNDDQEAAQTEVEWRLFQMAPAGKQGANEMMENEIALGDAAKSLIRRYEFYKYIGLTNPEDGEIICNADCENDPKGENPLSDHYGTDFVGTYVGQQMAGFNVVENQAPVPEADTYLMMLAGVGLLGLTARRRRGSSQQGFPA